MSQAAEKFKENKKKLFGDLDNEPKSKEKLNHLEQAEKTNAKLYETQSLMEIELERMRKVNITMHDTSEKLDKTDKTYSSYGENLSTANKILRDIYRTAVIQNIIENAAMYFFFAVCAYLFLERFYIWELIEVITHIFFSVFGNVIKTFSSALTLGEEY
mmetsp:Transcript_17289/g.15266  ORF Transcript_17289/g.15266 Transcript_17289/m.15266 type:complete len:159 (-) Transcript_17289:83-559(-)